MPEVREPHCRGHPALESKTENRTSQDPLSPDEPLAIDEFNPKKGLLKGVAVVAVIILSPSVGFCWRMIFVSFISLYYYLIFIVAQFRPPKRCRFFSVQMARFAAKTALHLAGLALLLAWCLSLTPVHIFVPTLIDYWTPYVEHDPMRMTEIVYDAGSKAAVDIFAIHGLASGPDSAWTYKSNATRVRWLSELLPQTEGFRDVRIAMINHQTRWDANTAYMELNDYASDLLENIESLHKALLLAKSRSKDVAAMTQGIIFLGAPHRGTSAAFAASCLSCMAFFRGSSTNLLEFMAVDGPGILDLESEFYDAYVLQNHPEDRPPYIFDVLEMRPEKMGKLAITSIVRPKHGLLRHGRVVTLDTDHRGLNKFYSSDDPNFQIFLRVLLQAFNHALQSVRTPGVHLPTRPLSLEQPAPIVPQANDTTTASVAPVATAPDILDFASYGLPWATRSRLIAAMIGAMQELVASWVAKDCSGNGSYFTSRVPKTAVYAAFIGVSVGRILGWVVYNIFGGYPSLGMRIVQIIVSNLMIVPLQNAVDLAAMAIIAGAQKKQQVLATVRDGILPLLVVQYIATPGALLFAHCNLHSLLWDAFFNVGLLFLQVYVNAFTKKKRHAALRIAHEREEEEGS
ncbi:Uu.00g001910.m01.CDS01 [Anthostomella pinea]|uniref:Uu.00g001910.m01.CDS01 n=1 Tax=Anthostomella pinea TaxID=933095 RepID=A0AAI8YIK4_9PEZI|nr:Uu.00g001910.m01.CDS01 [Anthostomella pinea]